MTIILITHPIYSTFYSIHLYTEMLKKGFLEKGYKVEVWRAKNYFNKKKVNKLLGYYYQFILFPWEFKKKIKKIKDKEDVLFVFTDQALGYLVPYFKNLPHIIHCHDFLAQKSALGELSENKVGITGKVYQKIIRRGYKKGSYFISISKATQKDLHRFLGRVPKISEVVYNGLNQNFSPAYRNDTSKEYLKKKITGFNENSYILHVGGDHFYKNREGVAHLFLALKEKYSYKGNLIMVGPVNNKLKKIKDNSCFPENFFFLDDVEDNMLKKLYSNADLFLFPSLEEGFGWPIAEAMASGCPVVTTDKPPMNEVGGDAAVYIPRLNTDNYNNWLEVSAKKTFEILKNLHFKEDCIGKGLNNAKRFDFLQSIEKMEGIYKNILKKQNG